MPLIFLIMVLLIVNLPVEARDSSNAKTETNKKLKKSDKIISYGVKINSELLDSLKRAPTFFDFSDVEILTTLNMKCFFNISRQAIETLRIEMLGRGALQVTDGRVNFLENSWRTGGISSPLFLQTEANLVIETSGSLVGRMPYFHSFINDGEVAKPPKYVTLGENKKKSGNKKTAEGLHVFFVDNWQRGRIKIRACKNIN
ncbi:hypothetical protein N8500_10815 [Candidatus Puniceispirillum sp.]|nr:hypothetical protein [Candidatus Puniceispirillum sp.]